MRVEAAKRQPLTLTLTLALALTLTLTLTLTPNPNPNQASMEPVLVLAHSGPCRALRAYFLSVAVDQCMGAVTSPGACALADELHSVVELRQQEGGGYCESIVDLSSVLEPGEVVRIA